MISLNTVPTNLELLASQAVEGFIIGLHKSPFHGFSVEFAEHRIFNPGDPLRHVDWRVFGRTDKLFVKRYEEETNLRCALVMDTSSSMHYPQEKDKLSKLQFSCIAAAAIIHLLKKQLDAGALILCDESIYYRSGCRSAHSHYRQLISKLEGVLHTTEQNKQTRIADCLHQVAEQMHRRSLIIIFTDALDDAEDPESFFAALQHLKYNKHEVILFHITEGQKELAFDFENRPYEFVDLETGDRIKLQPNQVKAEYLLRMAEWQKEVEVRCHQYKIDRVVVDLSQSVDQVLRAFLAKRNKMM